MTDFDLDEANRVRFLLFGRQEGFLAGDTIGVADWCIGSVLSWLKSLVLWGVEGSDPVGQIIPASTTWESLMLQLERLLAGFELLGDSSPSPTRTSHPSLPRPPGAKRHYRG